MAGVIGAIRPADGAVVGGFQKLGGAKVASLSLHSHQGGRTGQVVIGPLVDLESWDEKVALDELSSINPGMTPLDEGREVVVQRLQTRIVQLKFCRLPVAHSGDQPFQAVDNFDPQGGSAKGEKGNLVAREGLRMSHEHLPDDKSAHRVTDEDQPLGFKNRSVGLHEAIEVAQKRFRTDGKVKLSGQQAGVPLGLEDVVFLQSRIFGAELGPVRVPPGPCSVPLAQQSMNKDEDFV